MKPVSFLLTILLFISFSCGNKNKIPSDIIKPEKMKIVLWDVIRADAMATELVKRDTNRNFMEQSAILQKDIFSIHKISKDDYRKSFTYYTAHPELMKALMDSMTTNAYQQRPLIQPIKEAPTVADSL